MTWKYVCATSEVAENTLKAVEVEGVPVVVANYGGGFRAFPPVCPHMEEPLAQSGVLANCVLTCTKHLWAWNLDTLEPQAPAEKPLKTYELKQEDGNIFAFIEEELMYDFQEEDDDDMDDDFFARS